MTGIERLRELGREQDERSWSTVGKVRGRMMLDIADQIERERDEERSRWDDELCDAQMDKTCVMAVYLEMNRHVLGHEGMEDSPVARWARELRDALGGEKHDPAEDVSMSAYDLLPEEEHDAIAWVREHGGLDAVKRRWECLSYYADPVPRSCMEKRLARLQRQIDECHATLRRRNEEREQYVEANKRLLERGAELHRQLLKAQGDALEKDCNLAETKNDIREVCLAHGIDVPSGGDALDAIDMRLHDMQKALNKHQMPEGMEWPVFEDGEPVRIGDEVETENGQARKVRCIKLMGSTFCLCDMLGVSFYQSCYRNSVKRPTPKVLDADGVPIKVGDTVYEVGENYPPFIVGRLPEPGVYRSVRVVYPSGAFTHLDPERLTHTKPGPPDSWERLEEDAKKGSCDYFGCDANGCHGCPAYDWNTARGGSGCGNAKMRDIVRRAKKLAGDA